VSFEKAVRLQYAAACRPKPSFHQEVFMLLSITVDEAGRYLCDLADGPEHATVTASNVPEAGVDLLAALDDARDSGLGESLWAEQGGDYRWMFRRNGNHLIVAVMWCSGTGVGWQHVFRAEGDFEAFAKQLTDEMSRVAPATA
jgi:hypothetical protein